MPFEATPALSRPAESAARGSVVDGSCAEPWPELRERGTR